MRMKTKWTKDKVITFVTDFSRAALYLIAMCMLLWLNRYAISRGRHLYANDSSIRLLILRGIIFVGIVCASVAAGFLMEKLIAQKQRLEKIVLTICCLMFWCVCLWWVSIVPYKLEADQLIVWYNSVLASENDFIMQSHGGQMFLYPQQLGLSFLYELLFRITGNTDHQMIGYLTATLAPLTLFCGYQCVKECSGTKAAVRFLPFMMLCLPYIIYSPYVYGDIPSISYTFILLWAVLRAIKTKKIRYAVLACFVAAIALLSRMNVWIVLIGLAIGLAYHAFHNWNWKPALLAICILLGAFLSVEAVQQYNSYRSGYPVAEGMPSVLWIAMGMQEGGEAAGQYNNYGKKVYNEAEYDKKLAGEIGLQEVKDRLQIFIENPSYARDFFHEKMYTQWIDPLFESIKFTGTFEDQAVKPAGPVVVWAYGGDGRDVIERFSSHMLFMVYIFALLGVVFRFFQKKPIVQDIPLIVFVGGFLFSIIWEAKARYVLPYFVLLHVYAAYGLTYVSEWIKLGILKYKVSKEK